MKNAIVILSHCNTQEKLDVLKSNLDTLRKHQDFDIILTSHILLPQDILDKVDYFVYDKSNPILQWPDRGMFFWKFLNIDNTDYQLRYIQADYGWTVFNQIKLGGSVCLDRGYKNIYFMNYDLDISPEVDLTMRINDGNPYTFKVENWEKTIMEPALILFKLPSKYLKPFLDFITLDNYNDNLNFIPEDFLSKALKDVPVVQHPLILKDQIDFYYRTADKFTNSKYKEFQYFITTYDFTQWQPEDDPYKVHSPSIVFYDIKSPIEVGFENSPFPPFILNPGKDYIFPPQDCYVKLNGKHIKLETPERQQYVTIRK
jgi:hypothetical protein